jgi:hypothetical protein
MVVFLAPTDTVKSAILALFLLSTACACAADTEATVGASDCLVINPRPVPKETVKWSGPCKDGYAHGEGGLEWFMNGAFGSYYKGTMERGQKHGSGYWKDAGGSEYEGQFQRGLREGRGVMLFPDGDQYEGQWKAGAPDGTGLMVYALGGRYEGQWKNGTFHGPGKATYAGGQLVEGEFEHGVPRGGKPRERPAKVGIYALKNDFEKWNTYFKSDAATGSHVPYEKSYGEMSKDEQLVIKSRYRLLFEGDEPPYPQRGTKGMFTWFKKAADKVQASGMLRMDIMVDTEGNAESVTVHSAPHPDMKKLAVQIAMAEKYKPAVCAGKPCAMVFPFETKFIFE